MDEAPRLMRVPLDKIESYHTYLLKIQGEWFTAGFCEEGYLHHAACGQNTMWNDYVLETLIRKELLTDAFLIKDPGVE